MAENMIKDQNDITSLIIINFTLKTLMFLFQLLTFSYFYTILWMIICKLNYEIQEEAYIKGETTQNFFYIEYEIDKLDLDNAILKV